MYWHIYIPIRFPKEKNTQNNLETQNKQANSIPLGRNCLKWFKRGTQGLIKLLTNNESQ